ncbi:MAG: HlyD family type I secretion periplasmic adaptor subunit, partial [Pseudomonadota bacterium]
AVIATGTVELQSNRQVVQHPDGGVVTAILAKDGDKVQAGQIVLQLEDGSLTSELAIVTAQIGEISARRARLEAERDGSSEVVFRAALRDAAAANPDLDAQLTGQRNLFAARSASRRQQAEQLREQIAQSETNITGTQAQLGAVELQLDLIDQELTDQRSLLERGLTQATRVTALERERARLLGDIGAQSSRIAELKGQIAALNIEVLKLDVSLREEAITSLRDLELREIELIERQSSLAQKLERVNIRAPVSGIIYGATVFALQSVVQPAEPILYVIPQDQPLVVFGRVDPTQIEQIYGGQPSGMRFTAFDQRTTPELDGQVSSISADIFQDQTTGLSYYRVEVTPKPGELEKLGDKTLLPGMPVEVFMRTENRTPLSYLVKPLTDYFERAFRG